jgi:nitric oxide reductase NorQ protein
MNSNSTARPQNNEKRSGSSGILLKASESFVDTPRVRELTERALNYLSAGYPVHLAGPAGTGKTTLAFHIAAQLGRQISLLHGNDEFGSSDLIGRDAGYRKSTLVDNYVHSVLKTEEKLNVHWIDNRLTTACEQGHTLIYDEFNRTPPEANNTLLSILEERILNLPKLGGGDGYLRVHPSFRAIFTSNPEEYAGVHKAQDALLDRLITIQVDHYDQETEQGIAAAKSGLPADQVAYVVKLARALRTLGPSPHRPTIRACIAISKIVHQRGATAHPDDAFFRAVSFDVFGDGQNVFGNGGSRAEAMVQHEALLREVYSAHERGETIDFPQNPAAPHIKPRRNVRAA